MILKGVHQVLRGLGVGSTAEIHVFEEVALDHISEGSVVALER
jgi:hypothetical protein